MRALLAMADSGVAADVLETVPGDGGSGNDFERRID